MRIEIVDKCRYQTAGDYLYEDGELVIQVMKQSTPDAEFLIILHELFEEYASRKDGIPEQVILDWDLTHPELDEPGEHKDAPYHNRHMQAELLERIAAEFLGVDWKEYEQNIAVSE